MRINFKRIEIHNFLCFRDEQFDFNELQGLTLVCGKNEDIPGSKNGCGKSAIFSALVYALYGNVPNKIKNENIYNKYTGSKELRVVLWLDSDDKPYKIVSATNKYGSPNCTIFDLSSGSELDITKSTIAESRKFIETEIIHCDMPLFLRTILLTSDQTYNFFRLSKNDKKDFIEKLFDISIFGDMYSEIHKDLLKSEKDINAISNRIMILNKNNDDYVIRSNNHNEVHSRKIKDLESELEKTRNEYSKIKTASIQTNKDAVSAAEDQYNKYSAVQGKLNIAISKLNKLKSDLTVSIHKCESSRDLNQQIIDKHSDLLGKLCTDCKEIFKDYYNINLYTSKIEKLNSKIATFSEERNKITSKLDETTEKLNLVDDKLSSINQTLRSLTEEQNKANHKLTALDTKIIDIQNEIDRLKADENPYTQLINENNSKLEKELQTLNDVTVEYNYLEMAQSIVSQDTIRKFIIKDLISILNNRIKYYLMKMGAKFTVTFDENMNYEFYTSGGKCEYNNFSSGERMRVNVATSFAFRDFLGTRSNFTANILILDELIDSNLDSMSVENIIDILKEFVKNYSQKVYIISHRKEVNNSVFNNIMQLVKKDNVSSIKILSSGE